MSVEARLKNFAGLQLTQRIHLSLLTVVRAEETLERRLRLPELQAFDGSANLRRLLTTTGAPLGRIGFQPWGALLKTESGSESSKP